MFYVGVRHGEFMNVKVFLFLICIFTSFLSSDTTLQAAPFPINFSIPKGKIVKEIPEKEFFERLHIDYSIGK